MLIVMAHHSTPDQVRSVIRRIEDMGLEATPIPGPHHLAIGITGNSGPLDPGEFELLPGVLEAVAVTRPFKLVSREARPEGNPVEVGDVSIGAGHFVVIAGPCAVENEQGCMEVARQVKMAGAHILRGGAFKPRTSPYSFQGMGKAGLEILHRAGREFGLPVVTEALDEDSLALVVEYADIVQIGARNMQNFSLLRKAGRCGKPVFLKRGMSATLEELLMAAEYLAAEGNRDILLCERGIRTFGTHARNTLDLSVVPAVREQSCLPIFVDPSHGCGRRDKVVPLARASMAVGADGLMIEVHPEPDAALSDGAQSLLPSQFQELMDELRQMAPLLGRTLPAVAESSC